MRPLQTDLSIYNQFDFEKPPVGVKFLFRRPEGIEPLDKSLGFCEMIKEVHQRGAPFYFGEENEDCFGKAALGMMKDAAPFAESGELGVKLGIFQEQRANRRVALQNYQMGKGTVNYVALSPLDKLTFEPDLLIITATPGQAGIVLRAMTYSTGELYESRMAYVLGCSWLYVYPYLTGKVNFIVTGLGYGMKGRKAFEDGWILISIPFNWIPTITQNLNEMEWVPQTLTGSREEFMKREERLKDELAREFQDS